MSVPKPEMVTRKCTECGRKFRTMSASAACGKCVTKLAKAFWAAMGCEMPITPGE